MPSRPTRWRDANAFKVDSPLQLSSGFDRRPAGWRRFRYRFREKRNIGFLAENHHHQHLLRELNNATD